MRYAPDDTFAEIYYRRPDAVWPDLDVPELPWAWYLADWLHKPAETAAAGYMQFERPWPQVGSIEADKRWNLFPVAAMEYVARADRLFRVPEKDRSEKQRNEANEMMTEILEGLEP